jgi:hypothetical protein
MSNALQFNCAPLRAQSRRHCPPFPQARVLVHDPRVSFISPLSGGIPQRTFRAINVHPSGRAVSSPTESPAPRGKRRAGLVTLGLSET